MKKYFFISVLLFSLFWGLGMFCFKAEAAAKSDKFIEDLSLDFIVGEENSYVMVTILLNYNSINENVYVKDEKELMEVRKENKNYHIQINEYIIQSFPTLSKPIEMSKYSPFLFIEYKSYEDYKNDLLVLRLISEYKTVRYVHVESHKNKSIEDSEIKNSSKKYMSYSELKDIINIGTTSYTGKGIKVGVIDSGTPLIKTAKAIDNIKKDFSLYEEKSPSSINLGYHTSKVLSILAGEAELATNVEIYLHSSDASTSYTEMEFTPYEKLLDCGVNIINFSGCFTRNLDGLYLEWSAYIDYLVAHNNVVIVNSAGNESETKLIRYTATPANVLTVGAINYDRSIADYSSYKVLSPDRRNNIVNLVAPGNVWFNIDFWQGLHAGTSFSAPLVSAVVAMLMEEFPSCKYMPHLILNVLLHSATKLPTQTLEIDSMAGAGILNYQEARKILKEYQNKIDNKVNLNTSLDEKNYIIENFENSMYYDKEEVVNFNFYNIYDSTTITFTSMSEYYKDWRGISLTDPTLPSFVRYNLCIFREDEQVAILSSFSNFLQAKINLELGIYYTVSIYMINHLPSNIPDQLSIIISN